MAITFKSGAVVASYTSNPSFLSHDDDETDKYHQCAGVHKLTSDILTATKGGRLANAVQQWRACCKLSDITSTAFTFRIDSPAEPKAKTKTKTVGYEDVKKWAVEGLPDWLSAVDRDNLGKYLGTWQNRESVLKAALVKNLAESVPPPTAEQNEDEDDEDEELVAVEWSTQGVVRAPSPMTAPHGQTMQGLLLAGDDALREYAANRQAGPVAFVGATIPPPILIPLVAEHIDKHDKTYYVWVTEEEEEDGEEEMETPEGRALYYVPEVGGMVEAANSWKYCGKAHGDYRKYTPREHRANGGCEISYTNPSLADAPIIQCLFKSEYVPDGDHWQMVLQETRACAEYRHSGGFTRHIEEAQMPRQLEILADYGVLSVDG